jgi:lipoate-protein ligase B
VPCGIADHGVTSLQSAAGRALALTDVEAAIVRQFSAVFDRELTSQPA